MNAWKRDTHVFLMPANRQQNHAGSDTTRTVTNLGEIPTASVPMYAPNRGGVGSNWRFSTNISLYISETVQDMENTNRNSYALYRMALFPVTHSDQ